MCTTAGVDTLAACINASFGKPLVKLANFTGAFSSVNEEENFGVV